MADTPVQAPEAQPTPAAAPIAEQPAPQQQPQASQQLINVRDPDTGEIGGLPAHQLQDALQHGYQQVSPEEVDQYLKQQKYESPGQQVITGLEGAASGATFGLNRPIEAALGVKPEDILGREETNPGVHAIGQGLGIAGSALLGTGEASLLEHAGQAVADKVGLGAAESTIAKIGSMGVKAAVENSIIQTGDEVGKMLIQDPNTSVETAITNVGLAGLIGGAAGGVIGTVHPLWKATAGGKVGSILEAITKKAGGVEGQLPEALNDLLGRAGLSEVSPEVRSALMGDPKLQGMFQLLQESTTKSGLEAQKALGEFRKSVSEKLVETFGYTPEHVERLANLSAHEAGVNIVDRIGDSIERTFKPVSEEFNKIRDQFSAIPLTGESDVVADRLAQLGLDEGWGIAKNSSNNKYLNEVLGDLPNLNTLEDLRKYQSNVWSEAKTGKVDWSAAGKIVGVLRQVETETLEKAAGAAGEETFMNLQMARSAYQTASETMERLNERLKLKGWRGPESFVDALKEAGPEKILAKLTKENDVGLLNLLKDEFPQAAEEVRSWHVDDMLKRASQSRKAGPSELLHAPTLLKEFSDLSPEMRSFLLDAKGQDQLSALGKVLDAMPGKMNPPQTAKTLDALWKHVPGTAVGMASLLTGHNPVMGVILGGLTEAIGRDIPDAVRLATLKFLGSEKGVESEAFKAMTDFIQHQIKGNRLVSNSAKAIFQGSMDTLPRTMIPSDEKIKKLDKRLEKIQQKPEALLDVGGKTGIYLEDHAQHMAQTASNAVQYLSSLKPKEERLSPLDTKLPPDPIKQEKYERALTIAEQPLVVMESIKDGSLTAEDVNHIKTLYPGLYGQLTQKLTHELVTYQQKGDVADIPYSTIMSLSLFMGQPLETSLQPQSIQALQMAHMMPSQQQGPPAAGKLEKLKGMSSMAATSLEKSQMNKMKA